jgi:hypothetical protein
MLFYSGGGALERRPKWNDVRERAPLNDDKPEPLLTDSLIASSPGEPREHDGQLPQLFSPQLQEFFERNGTRGHGEAQSRNTVANESRSRGAVRERPG